MAGIDNSIAIINGTEKLTLDLVAMIKSKDYNVLTLVKIASDLGSIVKAAVAVWPELTDIDKNEFSALMEAAFEAGKGIYEGIVAGTKFA
jgi:hypothetical protein